MKLIVAGGRDYRMTVVDYSILEGICNSLQVSVVITGGARGVDTSAHQWAKLRGYRTHEVLADWDQYGKSAGAIRNGRMAELGDMLLAYPGGRGTDHMVHIAWTKGLQVIEVNR